MWTYNTRHFIRSSSIILFGEDISIATDIFSSSMQLLAKTDHDFTHLEYNVIIDNAIMCFFNFKLKSLCHDGN